MRRFVFLGLLLLVFGAPEKCFAEEALAPEIQTLEEVLIARAREALASDKPLAAIQALSEIGADSETGTVRAIARDALIRLSKQARQQAMLEGSVSVFKSSDVKSLVARTEMQFPDLKETLVVIQTWLLSQALEQNNALAAKDYYAWLSQRLPASSKELNEIRLRVILNASGAPMRDLAREIIQVMEGERALSPYVRFRLFMKGYYSGLNSLTILWLGLVAVVLAFIFLKLRSPGRKSSVSLKRPEKRGYQKPVEAEDEYSRLLALLGVEDGIADEELKSVYRELVRQYHPDRQAEKAQDGTSQPAPDPEKFQEIKVAYDRLIEMRKHRFRGK